MTSMKVVALRGESDRGKTQTLNIVYELLLTEGWQQVEDSYQDLCNGDFLDVLKRENKTIGIVTQGDYAIGICSVRNHLKTLEKKNCDIAVCACTIGAHKQKIQNAINSYPKHYYIDKEMCENKAFQRKENSEKAAEIIVFLKDIISTE